MQDLKFFPFLHSGCNFRKKKSFSFLFFKITLNVFVENISLIVEKFSRHFRVFPGCRSFNVFVNLSPYDVQTKLVKKIQFYKLFFSLKFHFTIPFMVSISSPLVFSWDFKQTLKDVYACMFNVKEKKVFSRFNTRNFL